MFSLARLKKRPEAIEEASDPVTIEETDDEAIIHQTVPDEVLYSEPKAKTGSDMSWLDSAPGRKDDDEDTQDLVGDERQNTTPTVKRAPVRARPVSPPAPAAPVAGAVTARIADLPANGEAAARPRRPVGWLVVVEGPGVGEWFVLERGLSHIGSAPGQTVRLDFGDGSVAGEEHARISYDEEAHAFVVDGISGLRVNGVLAVGAETVRDGDVITVGGTGLRLVALCSQNFNWTAESTLA